MADGDVKEPRLFDLYRGSDESHGETIQDGSPTGSPTTKPGPITPEIQEAHMQGRIRVGVVPVTRTGTSWFGAVDLDTHDMGKEVDIVALSEFIQKKGWPAIAVRTRRGGAHVNIFFSEPVSTRAMRVLLSRWAHELKGWGNPIEVFPKQSVLTGDNLGSWIHLPYMSGDKTNTYAVHGGQPLLLNEFITLALTLRQSRDDLARMLGSNDKIISNDFNLSGAPPCLKKIAEGQLEDGEGRNTALLNFAIFFTRSSQNIKDGLTQINATVMRPPVSPGIIKDLAKRIKVKDYNYQCAATPLCDNCDKNACLNADFGVKTDNPGLDYSIFRKLVKIEFYPDPVYLLHLRSRVCKLEGKELMDFHTVRLRIMEQLDEIFPALKPNQWETVLKELLEHQEVQQPPDNTSMESMIRELIITYIDPIVNGERRERKIQDILLHRPIIMNGRLMMLPDDFGTWARRRRVTVDMEDAWIVARNMGFHFDKYEIGDKIVTAWWIEIKPNKPVEFTPAPTEEY